RAVDAGRGQGRRVGDLDRDAIPGDPVARTAWRARADRDRLRSRSVPVCRAERLDASLTARCVVTRRPAREAVQSPREHTLRGVRLVELVAHLPLQLPPGSRFGGVVTAPKGEVRAESPQLRLPGIGEDLLLQLGPARDANLLHGDAFARLTRATLTTWRRRRPSPRASSFRSSPDCPASAPSTRSRSRRARQTSPAARSSARRSCSPSISPFG